ncbi:MAG: sodium/proton-translocating pyrophosphatase, partial [Planctomycetales bacterium]
MVRTGDKASQSVLLKALGRGINTSTFLVIFAAVGLTYWLMGGPFISISASVVIGLLAGWIIGKWTEYSTSDEFKPTQELAEQAVTGPATLIIAGMAEGMKSVWVPVVVICAATLAAFTFSVGDLSKLQDPQYFALGLYGVGIAAVGMLSTLGITLATDAYGPIADNAGGNAQMAELDPIVRERTDALDSLGNTTAATGKGFAIGSAALTALALLAAYVEEVRIGFKHMEEAVVAEHETAGFYKVTPQFIAVVKEEIDGKETNLVHRGLLILDGARHKTWAEIELGSRLEGPVNESGGGFLYTHIDGTEIEFDVVDRASATLPDFTRYYDASLKNPKVFIGVFLGAMSTFLFCAMTMKAV